MEKTLLFYTRLLPILWIVYGITSLFLHVDVLPLILTHCSFFVLIIFLSVLLLITGKNKHATNMLTLEAETKLQWEETMHALRNLSVTDTKKAALFERTYEVVKNLRRKEGDAIDADSTEEIKSIIKTIDELVKAEKKLKNLAPDL
jgi:hypothetical protein